MSWVGGESNLVIHYDVNGSVSGVSWEIT